MEKNGKHLKQNLLCIFSLLIASVFLIDLGVATGFVSLSLRRLLRKLSLVSVCYCGAPGLEFGLVTEDLLSERRKGSADSPSPLTP